MNKWSRQPQGRVKHETQEIYDILTNNHRGYGLDVNRWVKFLKECPTVISKDFETSAAELLFTKVSRRFCPRRRRIFHTEVVNPIFRSMHRSESPTKRRSTTSSS